jgi:hypothetical protein
VRIIGKPHEDIEVISNAALVAEKTCGLMSWTSCLSLNLFLYSCSFFASFSFSSPLPSLIVPHADTHVVVELTPDAMVELILLRQSALLRRRVFPSIKYYVKQGEVCFSVRVCMSVPEFVCLSLCVRCLSVFSPHFRQEKLCYYDMVAAIGELACFKGMCACDQ